MSRSSLPTEWNSRIPFHNKYGTVLSRRQRELIAKKLGLCLTCETQTHNVRAFRTTPLHNHEVYKGVCIKCNRDDVPAAVYSNYKRMRQEQKKKRSPPLDKMGSGQKQSTGSMLQIDIPGTFSDDGGTVPTSPPGHVASIVTPSPGRAQWVPAVADTTKELDASSSINNSRPQLPAMPPEPFPKPMFHEAAPRPVVTVKEYHGIEYEEQVYLVRNSRKSVVQAYRKLPDKKTVRLGFGSAIGEMVICVVLPRIQTAIGDYIVFEEPDPDKYQCVAIKKWNRSIVDPSIVEGHGIQNPYNEISILQNYGGTNDAAVTECVEALIDSQYIYVVLHYCEFCKSLQKRISSSRLMDHARVSTTLETQGLSSHDARELFAKLLGIMEYLQKNRICHRNLTPSSVAEMYGTESYGSCRLNDFSMSLLVPYSKSGLRHYVEAAESCGSCQHMAPELFQGNKEFDGYAIDVWSMGTILFEMLAGRPLYRMPHVSDRCFLHFIINRGLSNEEGNLRMQEYLLDQRGFGGDSGDDLTLNAKAVLDLNEDARDLLNGMLELDSTRRLSLLQVKQHRFLRGTASTSNLAET